MEGPHLLHTFRDFRKSLVAPFTVSSSVFNSYLSRLGSLIRLLLNSYLISTHMPWIEPPEQVKQLVSRPTFVRTTFGRHLGFRRRGSMGLS